MSSIDILVLAVALSIDACVVAFAYGLIFTSERTKNSLLLSSFCGFFQGIMPIIGYFALKSFTKTIEPYSEWIVFTIFLLLGLNFIKDALKNECEEISCLGLKCLFSIAFATSIDALAAGASIALKHDTIWFPAGIIALVTFINSMVGFWSGNCLKKFPTKILKFFAAFLLIFLAFKSLF